MDISYLLWLQDFRNGLGSVFETFFLKMSYLGEMNVVLTIMAAIYWCVSKEYGTYLLMGWSGCRVANGLLKVAACVYRPWIRCRFWRFFDMEPVLWHGNRHDSLDQR